MFIRKNILVPRFASFCLLLFFLSFSFRVAAQSTSVEFWPETDIWYRLSNSWRLSIFAPITKYNESQYRDLNIYFQADYAFGHAKLLVYRRLMDENRARLMKIYLVRGLFMEGWSLGENVGAYRERMIFAEIHKRTPRRGNILLSHRIRNDYRWLGSDLKFSYRIRYRIMIEKDYKLGKTSLVPYFNVEPFWDSRYPTTITKTRAIIGATASWGPRFAYEGNILYQYDETYNTPNLIALNLILHVFFESKKVRLEHEDN